ncbi:MAG: hypothetical protein MI741_21890 [Rhodospirillales bacterium]|nr:hypothetical protein [Rhodospirillales bacterium]
MELPAYLKSGEIARLIPVIGDVRKEQRAASVLLATLSAIPDFSNALLTPLGQRIGNKTTVNTFTETVFVSDGSEKDRPDGLIEIRARNRTWTALVEAKIGRGRLEKDQLERYLQLARNHSLDALITISNEFVARPTFHPVAVNKQKKERSNFSIFPGHRFLPRRF